MEEYTLDTPIAIIIFNRPDLTEKLIAEIGKVKPKKMFVIADGPRVDRPGEQEKCEATRNIINQIDWECEIFRNYSDVNLGCDQRIPSGIDWVFQNVDEAIILEDDVVPHISFYRYCQELLEKYRNDERIMIVSGANYLFGRKRTNYSYYFSRYCHMPGWATWKRAWENFDINMKLCPEIIENGWVNDIFQKKAPTKYWTNMFKNLYMQKDSPWDLKWVFNCMINNGLCVVPNINMITNVGYRPDGTHTNEENIYSNMKIQEMKFPILHQPFIIRNSVADNYIEESLYSSTFLRKVLYKLGFRNINSKF